MAKYYFVTTLLPPLKIGEPPDIGSRELDFILKLNIQKEDFEKLTILRRLVDIENLRLYWQGQEILPSGNFDEKEIEEYLLRREKYPQYVFDFMDTFGETESRLKHFTELLRTFFKNESAGKDGFVKEYIKFEREWRLIFVAIRAKSLGRNIIEEMKFEDPEDPLVQSILEQKDLTTYTPPEDYSALKTIYESNKDKPLELDLQFSEWRFNHIDEMVGWHTFDLRRILGYIVQLEIIERWFELDKKRGYEILEGISTSVETK